MQENPNKSKEKSLDFLEFPWPIRGFSMGYDGKNKKNSLRLNSRRRLRPTGPRTPFSPSLSPL
jgi:hypothetical protein